MKKEDILREMKERLPRAWDKAINHRGISSSFMHEEFLDYLNELGDDDLAERYTYHYAQYGVPLYWAVWKKYPDMPDPPKEYYKELKRMSEGRPCVKGCDRGCGV